MENKSVLILTCFRTCCAIPTSGEPVIRKPQLQWTQQQMQVKTLKVKIPVFLWIICGAKCHNLQRFWSIKLHATITVINVSGFQYGILYYIRSTTALANVWRKWRWVGEMQSRWESMVKWKSEANNGWGKILSLAFSLVCYFLASKELRALFFYWTGEHYQYPWK